jgi:hypothetical protein
MAMKRSLVIAFAVILCSSLAMAQGGVIGLYSDPVATDCNVYDYYPTLVNIYVVHVLTTGATSAQFMVNPVDGAYLIFLGDIIPYPYIAFGNSQVGISVGFGGCKPSPNLILTMQYFGQGISLVCSSYRVFPDPIATPPGEIWVGDCVTPYPNQMPASGGLIYVNPDLTCTCTIPVKETTWGGLKALYR